MPSGWRGVPLSLAVVRMHSPAKESGLPIIRDEVRTPLCCRPRARRDPREISLDENSCHSVAGEARATMSH